MSAVVPPRPSVQSTADTASSKAPQQEAQTQPRSNTGSGSSTAGHRRRVLPPADDDGEDEESINSGTMKFSSTILMQRESDADSVASSDVSWQVII